MRRNTLFTKSVQNLSQETLSNTCYHEVWQIIPTETPKIIKRCSRCSGDRFYSSDKFRVNANKKLIDVWLIYKCMQCDATLNHSIISRTTISKIDRDLFQKLQENDCDLAWKYAFDTSLLQKGVIMDWNIDFEVQVQAQKQSHQNTPMDQTQDQEIKKHILIQADFGLKISIASILREKMQISRSQLEKLQQKGALELYSLQGALLTLKAPVGKGCLLLISQAPF